MVIDTKELMELRAITTQLVLARDASPVTRQIFNALPELLDAADQLSEVTRERDNAKVQAQLHSSNYGMFTERCKDLQEQLAEVTRERDAAIARAERWKQCAKRLYNWCDDQDDLNFYDALLAAESAQKETP